MSIPGATLDQCGNKLSEGGEVPLNEGLQDCNTAAPSTPPTQTARMKNASMRISQTCPCHPFAFMRQETRTHGVVWFYIQLTVLLADTLAGHSVSPPSVSAARPQTRHATVVHVIESCSTWIFSGFFFGATHKHTKHTSRAQGISSLVFTF